MQINQHQSLTWLFSTVFRKSCASPRFGEKTWNFRNPSNLTFWVWLKLALIIIQVRLDRFLKKFRIATIWREILEFSKSEQPNFLGLAKISAHYYLGQTFMQIYQTQTQLIFTIFFSIRAEAFGLCGYVQGTLMYSLTPSWPVYQLHNLHCYIQLRPQVGNGSSLKYRVLCCGV